MDDLFRDPVLEGRDLVGHWRLVFYEALAS